MFRNIAIWVFGLIASALAGMTIGAVLMEQGAGLGLIAGDHVPAVPVTPQPGQSRVPDGVDQ